jgi:hypothetical protein
MILNHKDLNIKTELLSFKKKIKYSDNFIFIPIKYENKELLIQTPDLFIPFDINKYSDKCTKQYLDLSFQSSIDNKQTELFINNLKNIHNKTIKNYESKYEISDFIKENEFSKWMRFKISEESLVFNQNKEKIEKIISKTYGVFIIGLSGLWIMDNKVWFNWEIIQSKIYVPIKLKEYYFFDDEKEIIITPKRNIPPPPPPPPPPVKKSQNKIIIQKKNIKFKQEEKFFQPNINELLLALKTLRAFK